MHEHVVLHMGLNCHAKVGLAPDGVSGMQMRQFWRPSAWADYLHAYTPTNRLLLSKDRHSHLLFSPVRFILLELPSIGWISYEGLGSRSGWLSLLLFVVMWCSVYLDRLQAAMKRNLTPDDKTLSTNMPTLFAHLRQLEAAGCVIKSYIAHDRGPILQANAASMYSNLALMQATRHLSIITANLEARLVSAYNKCYSYRSNWGPAHRLDAEAELAGHIRKKSKKANALQRIQDSMVIGVQAVLPGMDYDAY